MKHFLHIAICLLFFCSPLINAQTYNTFYNSVVSNVSSSNILADLNSYEDFGIKSIGTPALNNTQNWIKARYESLGYTDIVEQPFSYSGGTTNNIIVTKTGTVYPDTFLIIDAHYDTINGPGTNDNGSGTVLIMELARLLKDVDTEYSIKFIHFSGEEPGLIGSNYYVNNTVIPQNLDISLVFNIDEVGGVNGMVNDIIVCEKDIAGSSANNAASADATTVLANSIGFYSNLNTQISNAYASDYIPFENNGEIITGLFEKNETPHAHTSTDVLTNMDVDYLYEVTKGALGAALHFAVGVETLGVSTIDSIENSINLHPNPTHGILNIDYNTTTPKDLKLEIRDILGKKTFSTSIDNQIKSLDLSFLNKGIYFAAFKNNETTIVKKIIIN